MLVLIAAATSVARAQELIAFRDGELSRASSVTSFSEARQLCQQSGGFDAAADSVVGSRAAVVQAAAKSAGVTAFDLPLEYTAQAKEFFRQNFQDDKELYESFSELVSDTLSSDALFEVSGVNLINFHDEQPMSNFGYKIPEGIRLNTNGNDVCSRNSDTFATSDCSTLENGFWNDGYKADSSDGTLLKMYHREASESGVETLLASRFITRIPLANDIATNPACAMAESEWNALQGQSQTAALERYVAWAGIGSSEDVDGTSIKWTSGFGMKLGKITDVSSWKRFFGPDGTAYDGVAGAQCKTCCYPDLAESRSIGYCVSNNDECAFRWFKYPAGGFDTLNSNHTFGVVCEGIPDSIPSDFCSGFNCPGECNTDPQVSIFFDRWLVSIWVAP